MKKVKVASIERLDILLSKELGISRSQVQKKIKENRILLNEQPTKCSVFPEIGDIVSILPDLEKEMLPIDIPLEIVYEDDYLMIVNKPNGLVVHPACGHSNDTLVNALLAHSQKWSTLDKERPGIVHRIDADTTGLLVVAKTNQVHTYLQEQLKENKAMRKYLALVWGVIPNDTGTIDAPIGRSDTDRKKMAVIANHSKPAVTHFKVLERYPKATLLEVTLETGRTHQIRVHMQYIGYPIVNDKVYGKRKPIDETGQCLHAQTLGFMHPVLLQYMEFTCPLPDCFTAILEKAQQDQL